MRFAVFNPSEVNLRLSCAVVCYVFCTTSLFAQNPNERTRIEFDRLRQQDSSLRSALQGQRIDRQSEIVRLESRLAKLEDRLEGLPSQSASLRLIDLLLILEMAEGFDNVQMRDEAADDADGTNRPTGRRMALLQLVVKDYLLDLQVKMLQAKISLTEESAQLMSLQRLAGKGLASRQQLELQKLKSRMAAAQLRRLEDQQEGLTKILPEGMVDLTVPNEHGDDADQEELPSPPSSNE